VLEAVYIARRPPLQCEIFPRARRALAQSAREARDRLRRRRAANFSAPAENASKHYAMSAQI